MNHEDTKTQRVHEENFVLLSAFESLWFKFKPTNYLNPEKGGMLILLPQIAYYVEKDRGFYNAFDDHLCFRSTIEIPGGIFGI